MVWSPSWIMFSTNVKELHFITSNVFFLSVTYVFLEETWCGCPSPFTNTSSQFAYIPWREGGICYILILWQFLLMTNSSPNLSFIFPNHDKLLKRKNIDPIECCHVNIVKILSKKVCQKIFFHINCRRESWIFFTTWTMKWPLPLIVLFFIIPTTLQKHLFG